MINVTDDTDAAGRDERIHNKWQVTHSESRGPVCSVHSHSEDTMFDTTRYDIYQSKPNELINLFGTLARAVIIESTPRMYVCGMCVSRVVDTIHLYQEEAQISMEKPARQADIQLSIQSSPVHPVPRRRIT
jgi:hypothetical protein